MPRRTPVGPPEATGGAGSPVAGWENLLLDLSTDGGIRVLTVLLDAGGQVLSASDHVHFRSDGSDGSGPRIRQESIGGRFETDGSFRGTCWLVSRPEPENDEPPQWEMTPRPPRPEEVERLRALVAELLRRQPG